MMDLHGIKKDQYIKQILNSTYINYGTWLGFSKNLLESKIICRTDENMILISEIYLVSVVDRQFQAIENLYKSNSKQFKKLVQKNSYEESMRQKKNYWTNFHLVSKGHASGGRLAVASSRTESRVRGSRRNGGKYSIGGKEHFSPLLLVAFSIRLKNLVWLSLNS